MRSSREKASLAILISASETTVTCDLAVKAIAANKADEALAALERATGKINILLARNPTTALIPVSLEVEVIDAAPRDSKAISRLAQDDFTFTAWGIAGSVSAAPAQRDQTSSSAQERIARELRHELLMLPWYGIFDNITYKLDGSNVTLYGQVVRPSLKSDAENAVKHIEGVEQVDNQIEVLPLSRMDDRLRIQLFHAIYG